MDTVSFIKAGQYLGAGLAMGFGAIGAALGEGMTGGFTNPSISRRISMAPSLTRTMLVAQAMAETSAIFALMVAVLLLFTDMSPNGPSAWAAAIGAGLSIGLGSFGSGIGSGYPGAEATWGISRQPGVASEMTTTMLVGQAVGQTPAIFALMVAFMLIFRNYSGPLSLQSIIAPLAAGICMGFGAMGPGYGNGLTSGKACEALAIHPQKSGLVMRTMLVAQAVAQSTAIYALVIAFVLLFVV